MSTNKDKSADIADVLDMLKKSYNSELQDGNDNDSDILIDKNSDEPMSASELKEKLRIEFFEKQENSENFSEIEDFYKFDESFITDVKTSEVNDVVPSIIEKNISDETFFASEESEQQDFQDEEDDVPPFDIDDDDIDMDIGSSDYDEFYSEDEDETDVLSLLDGSGEYDYSEEDEYFEEDKYSEKSEELFFEEAELYEEPEELVLQPLKLEDENDNENDNDNDNDNEQTVSLNAQPNEIQPEDEERISLYEFFVNKKIQEAEELEAYKESFDEEPALEYENSDAIAEDDEIFDDLLDQEADYNKSASGVERSEISLLLQFGDEDDIVTLASGKGYENVLHTDENKQENIKQNKDEEKEIIKEIKSFYEKMLSDRKKIILPLILAGIFAFVLLIYEGLPLLGVQFSGIFNKNEWFIPYVLFGLQFMIFGILGISKKLWSGIKSFFELKPNTYSLLAVFAIIMVAYDISVSIASLAIEEGNPSGFHMLFMFLVICVLIRELQHINSHIKTFKFYFVEYISNDVQEDVHRHKFTLLKSKGKNSTAEKMKAGGLDPKKDVYFPFEIETAIKYFNSIQGFEKTSSVSVVGVVISVAFSFVLGIICSLKNDFFMFSNTIVISLYATLPILSILFAHLSFERLCYKNDQEGYAFANEDSLDAYSTADMLIFKDMHLFKKASPSRIKLALYDATSKEVLLGCLNAVYKEIGGPLRESFKNAENPKLGKCKISRIAKGGIEAFVGNNYSVLIGNEQFLSRYGIIFPKAVYGKKEDELFTLCISINGRTTARLAVKYEINEMFDVFVDRLAEDNIFCVVETFDPLINTAALSKIIPDKKKAVSIVHLNVSDLKNKENAEKEKLMLEYTSNENVVLARTSRLNLAVALSTAKKMKKLKKLQNIYSIVFSIVGALLMLLFAVADIMYGFMALFVPIYWLLGSFGLVMIITKLLPQKSRFFFKEREKNKYDKVIK